MIEIIGKVKIDEIGDYWRVDVHQEGVKETERNSTLEEILLDFIGHRVKITVESAKSWPDYLDDAGEYK